MGPFGGLWSAGLFTYDLYLVLVYKPIQNRSFSLCVTLPRGEPTEMGARLVQKPLACASTPCGPDIQPQNGERLWAVDLK